jgi:hypothetical protein
VHTRHLNPAMRCDDPGRSADHTCTAASRRLSVGRAGLESATNGFAGGGSRKVLLMPEPLNCIRIRYSARINGNRVNRSRLESGRGPAIPRYPRYRQQAIPSCWPSYFATSG